MATEDRTFLLDCSLRDGGYYNRWDFDIKLAHRYFSTMAEVGVDLVELGRRDFAARQYLGAFAYSTDHFIDSLDLPDGPKYGVMIDAKSILSRAEPIAVSIDQLFKPARDSRVDFVRVAAQLREVEGCHEIADALSALGYFVCLNLMQAGGRASSDISDAARDVASWGSVDVLYFADSLGNMDAQEVIRITDALKLEWHGPLGIHTHNNMNQAVSNSLVAADIGVQYVDATVSGIGRGAGNAQTEVLLLSSCKGIGRRDSHAMSELWRLVLEDFEPMKAKYGWGFNLLYYLSAVNSVHPMYVQSLLSSPHYRVSDVLGAVEYLSELESSNSFSNEVLEASLVADNPMGVSGQTTIDGLFADREVLILGSGPSVSEHIVSIEHYAKSTASIVIVVNINSDVPNSIIDYYCVTHNAKYFSESDKYEEVRKPLILPENRFKERELSAIPASLRINYPLRIRATDHVLIEDHCEMAAQSSLAFAVCAAIRGGAVKVALAGIDGYEASDQRQLELNRFFSHVTAQYSAVPIFAVTPTTYPIDEASVYAPIL